MQKDTFSIGHKVNSGDLISAMAGMFGLYKKYGKNKEKRIAKPHRRNHYFHR